jgi:hypothetical protein
MSQIPINLPARIMKGQTVTALHMNALREAIYRLASRKHDKGNGMPSEGFTHPWKVTANGDDSVTVAKGKILSWSNQSAPPTDTIPIYYHLKEFKNYAGGIVESINANGVIYGSIPFIQAEVLYEADSGAGSLLLSQRIVPDVSATLSVAFATELPVTGNVFIFEIAKVTFADGVATVSDQVLEHNPQMWAFDLQIIPPA